MSTQAPRRLGTLFLALCWLTFLPAATTVGQDRSAQAQAQAAKAQAAAEAAKAQAAKAQAQAAKVQVAQAQGDIFYDENVTYGKGGEEELKLDIARPKEGGPFPAVVWIHGGAWRGGNRSVYRPAIKEMAKKGYVAVTVSYRFCPKNTFPAQIEDVKCAVRWLRANAKQHLVDPDHIGATGASAGGHLALMLGVMGSEDGLEGEGGHPDKSSKVQAVVNWFGPTELTKPFPPNIQPLLTDFLGGRVEDKMDAAKKGSPITYLSKDDGPILTLHGDKDNIVPYEQATLLVEGCKRAKIDHSLVTVEGAGHGWGDEKLTQSLNQTTEFFDKHLKKSK
ncbi:MAG: alpha/beta hydrolase [Planctomycetia bacterium]|nr:alpha/beta hydrolase [Planctomycetia bacterium]